MSGFAQRILSFFPGRIRFFVIGFVIYCAIQFILAAGWLLVLVTSMLWALVLLSLARETGSFQLAARWPLNAVLDWLTFGKRYFPDAEPMSRRRSSARANAHVNDEQRRRLAAQITAPIVRNVLDGGLLGQKRLNEDVACEVEAFVRKRSPTKPLSLAIAGAPASGRTTFGETLALATVVGNGAKLIRIDCADDAEADLSQIANAAAGMSLPVLMLDNFDRLGSGRHAGGYVGAIARLLDDGIIAGRAVLRHAIIVLTIRIDASKALEAWQRCERMPEERVSIMRQAVRETGHVPDDILFRLDFVGLLAPLEPLAQVAVVWKVFCAKVAKEHGVTILEDDFGGDPGLINFLIGAQAKWQQTGDWGVYEAARSIEREARDALTEASRNGYRTVRARWDRRAKGLRLDPVASPVTAS
jgi:hypothetical protein